MKPIENVQLKSITDLKPILDNFNEKAIDLRENVIPGLDKRIEAMNNRGYIGSAYDSVMGIFR